MHVEGVNTQFGDNVFSNPTSVTVYGYEGSTSQAYANEVGATFVATTFPPFVLSVHEIEDAYLGQTLEIQALVEGGFAPFVFRFEIEENGVKTVSTEYSEESSIAWTPAHIGSAQIRVSVRDYRDVVRYEEINIDVKEKISVKYSGLVQNDGWQDYVRDGESAGTSGQSKKLEAIRIEVLGTEYSGDIEYQTHIQRYGWESEWKKNGEISGSLESLRLESMRIRLTGELAEHYDVYYRLHVQKFGWLDWAKNGENSGSSGFSYRVEGIQIKLVEKDGPAPGPTENIFHDAIAEKFTQVNYQTQVQRYGWLETVSNGEMSGTQQQGLRVEGIKIWLSPKGYSGSVEYKTMIQNKGWETEWKKDGELSGTQQESLRLEAIQIRLTEELADKYDIYYRVQAQRYGWLGWACNGEKAGTSGEALRLEAVEIKLVEKGGPAPGSTENPYIQK